MTQRKIPNNDTADNQNLSICMCCGSTIDLHQSFTMFMERFNTSTQAGFDFVAMIERSIPKDTFLLWTSEGQKAYYAYIQKKGAIQTPPIPFPLYICENCWKPYDERLKYTKRFPRHKKTTMKIHKEC